jgi:hypothetical protein
MKNPTFVTLALAAGVFAVPIFAAEHASLDPAAAAAHEALAALQPAHVRAAQPGVKPGAPAPKVMGTHTLPGTPQANPFRAYPPSCAADPLPDLASGPTYTGNVTLFARDAAGNAHLENVAIRVWRIACSSSGAATPYNSLGAYNAMTLMRIDRAAQFEGDRTVFPTFPLVEASQDGSAFGTTASFVRAAIEPNTVISETTFDSPIFDSTTYVLENYPYDGSGYFTYSDGFTLRIDPGVTGIAPLDIVVPPYDPTPVDNPLAFSPLPIDGYLSSAWYDPAHSGEGLVLQVVDNADQHTHTLFAAWYTFDANGLPFWLIAQGVVAPGATAAESVPVYYYTGGGFAGDFGAQADSHVWGTMDITFPHCNELDFSFDGQTDPQIGGPSGTGTRSWVRIANINGLSCE